MDLSFENGTYNHFCYRKGFNINYYNPFSSPAGVANSID